MPTKPTTADRKNIKELWIRTEVAADEYVYALKNMRKEQWQFLAYIYLFHKALMVHGKRTWSILIGEKLGRKLRKPEQERPYMALLHIALSKHIKGLRIKTSKMCSALEMVEKHFKNKKVDHIQIIRFIERSGGVAGLYKKYRENQNRRDGKNAEIRSVPIESTSFCISKLGGKYKIRLPKASAGRYMISVQIDKQGYITKMEPVGNNQKVA